MKKIIFAIFAHPDDEAFGPAGTLLMESKLGNDVHLITLTLGDAGSNPDNVAGLAEVRHKEWRRAGQLIGAKSMHFLGYKDGQLDNLAMLELHDRLRDLITSVIDDQPADVEVELLSIDSNGITGHIDHIVASRSACYAFYNLKQTDRRFSRIRLACVPKVQLPEANIDWLYMEAGRDESEITETVDASQYRAEIIEIIRTHHSQRSDGQNYLDNRADQIGIDHFIVKT